MKGCLATVTTLTEGPDYGYFLNRIPEISYCLIEPIIRGSDSQSSGQTTDKL